MNIWRTKKFIRDFRQNMIGWLLRIFCQQGKDEDETWYKFRLQGVIFHIWIDHNTNTMSVRLQNQNGNMPVKTSVEMKGQWYK
jgi:hypothetical protein